MTTKVLPGASREALAFLFANWQSLLKMSVVPFAGYIFLTLYQLNALSHVYRQLADLSTGGQINPAFFGAYMQGMALSSLSSLVASMLLCTLFVQIIRFQKTGASDWIMRDKAGWMAGVMTYLYALGMMMLTIVAYLGAALAGVVVALLLGGLGFLVFGNGAAGGIFMGLFMIVFFFAFLTFLYWFMFRFFVGLPGVALGHSPDFFRDIWPLAKGEGLGLPLRMIVATLAAYIPIVMVVIASGYIFMGDSFAQLLPQMASSDPSTQFRALADMMETMGWLFGLTALLFMPFMWFVSLLLGVAFKRFRGKSGQVLK
jgi:hypothetical protein